MAGVDYSIFLSAPQAGPATVNVLQAPTRLVGVVMTGQYFGIQLDPVRIAYIPNVAQGGIQLPMIPVYYEVLGIQLNVIYQSSGQNVVLYFGEPTEDAIPLEAYVGVLTTVSFTNSGTSPANVNNSATFSFPQGTLRLIGIAYLTVDNNSAFDQWYFNTAGGLQVTSVSVQGIAGGGRLVILPLDFIPVPQSLTITIIANQVKASSTHQAVIIMYYTFE